MDPRPPDRSASAWRRDDRHDLLLGALLWVLVVLMIVPEGLDYEILSSTGAPASADLLSRVLWLGLLALSVAIIVGRASLATALARELNPFLPLLVLLALASVAWSIDPALTTRRLYRLVTIVLGGVAFVLVGWHARRLQNVLRPILTLMLAGSLLFVLAAPSLGTHREQAAELAGAWRGLANHKNGLGALACTGLLFWLHAALAREVRWLPALAAITLAGTCLVMSRSSTSLVAAVFGASFLVFSLRAPLALRAALPALVVGLLAVLLLYALGVLDLIPGSATLLAPITAFTEKNATLTGRTQIWAILAEHVRQSPWLGTGYGAYWTAGPIMGTDAYEFVRRMGNFYPGSAHNGALEIANDLGGIGLAGLAGYAVTHVGQSLRLLRLDRTQATLYLAVFFQQAITNLAETHWFSVLSVDFVIMTLASTALARSLLEQRLRRAFGEPPARGSPAPSAPTSFARRPGLMR